jgi:hypothetical protein
VAKSKATIDAGRSTCLPPNGELGRSRPPACDPGARGRSVRPTKHALIIGPLQRDEGAALADLVAATGWFAHTTRTDAAAGEARAR